MSRALALLLVLVPLLLLPAPAGADKTALRKQHVERALAAANAERYREAIAEFQLAYEAEAKPFLLFNIAHEYDVLAARSGELDDLRDAIRYFEKYLVAKPSATDRREREADLVRLRAAVAAREAATRPAAVAPASPPPPAPLPATAPSPLLPPSPAVAPPAITAPAAKVDLPAPPSSRPPRRLRSAGLGVGIAGLAIGLAGGSLIAVGTATHNNVTLSTTTTAWRAARSDGQTYFNSGLALASLGGAALLTGALLIALPNREQAKTTWWLAPAADGVIAGGTF